ncbi:MAG: dihydroorotate dehydrogenase electron transfer subunit [Clostridia bacterium]|nr:dihydroorotate dehydrogenase electron transfer subunit [Clostridia bacterium]
MKDLSATVLRNAPVAENIYEMTLSLAEDIGPIKGGQFLSVSTGEADQLLRRPFGVLKSTGTEVSIGYQIKGAGTQALSRLKPGKEVMVLLPLGNGFSLDGYSKIAVIGGGAGIFPLIATISQNYNEKDFFSYIGFRNAKAVCYTQELSKSRKLTISTDDGSYGVHANAVQTFMADQKNLDLDCIIACGPVPMLKALSSALTESGCPVPCFASMEERMGCGIGACLACVCKGADGGNLRVCKDGPVFDIKDLAL